MSVYSREEERAIRQQRLVNDWAKSGLVSAEQRERMLTDLTVDLRLTNQPLRLTLFVFGLVIVNAAAALVALTLAFSDALLSWLPLPGAIASVIIARFLVKEYRLYHFGVEEAAAIASVAFWVLFAALRAPEAWATTVAFAAATAGAGALFVHFGYAYAAIAATLLAPLIVFDIEQSDTFRRLVAFALLFTVFFVARERREDHDPDHPADTYGLVQAVAWAAMYVIANMKISALLSAPDGYDAVYWTTYVIIWIMPFAGLFIAIRDRDRAMLNVNIVLLIVTMLSNKPYLGAAPQPWDPILFGLLLIGGAVGMRRWLSSGPGATRAGFVADRMLVSEQELLSFAGNATVLAPGAPPAPPQESTTFGGGASGGAGATERF